MIYNEPALPDLVEMFDGEGKRLETSSHPLRKGPCRECAPIAILIALCLRRNPTIRPELREENHRQSHGIQDVTSKMRTLITKKNAEKTRAERFGGPIPAEPDGAEAARP